MLDIEKQIVNTLEKIRPFLQRDGGDVVFDSFKDGIVYVRMQGACVDCLSLDSTVKDGIQIILTEEVPGIIAVEVIPPNHEVVDN